jgi:hypothetical protein
MVVEQPDGLDASGEYEGDPSPDARAHHPDARRELLFETSENPYSKRKQRALAEDRCPIVEKAG